MIWPGRRSPTRALLAAARLINAVLSGGLHSRRRLPCSLWLSLETLRIWLEHGPARTLLGPASAAAFAAVALRGDYVPPGIGRCGGSWSWARPAGYEPDTSQARLLFAIISYWFEPIENGVQAMHQAREGLIAGGDLAKAGYTYYGSAIPAGLRADAWDAWKPKWMRGWPSCAVPVTTGPVQMLDHYRWLAGVLRGEISAAAGEAATIGRYSDNPLALLYAHVSVPSPPPSSAIRRIWCGTPRRRCRCYRPPWAST